MCYLSLWSGNRILAVDVSSERVVVCHVERSKSGIKLLDVITVGDVSDCFNNNNLMQVDRMVDIILAELRANKIKTNKIWLSYGSEFTQTKILKTTDISDSDIGAFAVYEGAKQFPSRNESSYVLDYQVMGKYSISGDVNNYILLVSALKNEISSLISVFKKRGYDTLVVDEEVNSLKNTFVHFNKTESSTVNLHIGKYSSKLFLIVGSVLVFSRDINFGYRNIVNAYVNDGFGDAEKFDRECREFGIGKLIEKLDVTRSNEITGVLSEYFSEVQKSIDYIRPNFNIEFDHISLTGEFSNVSGISDLLANNLEVRVSEYVVENSNEVFSNVDGTKLCGGVLIALGLSLRGFGI